MLRYLNPETESKITETVTREVLSNQEDELLNKEGSGCRALMINDMKDDLARMYRMFSGIPDGLLPMALIFKAYIIECGNGKISERTSRLAALETMCMEAQVSRETGCRERLSYSHARID